MSDVELQDLLRRHHGGEDVAVALAHGLRRSGRAREAVELFGATRGAGPLRDEAELAWKETLRGLLRVAEFPEAPGEYRLRGWSRSSAVLMNGHLDARLLDIDLRTLGRAWPTRGARGCEAGMFVVVPSRFGPVMEQTLELITREGASLTAVRTDVWWDISDVSPDGSIVVLWTSCSSGAFWRFVRVSDGAELRRTSASDRAWSWSHDRLAWAVQDRLLCGRISDDSPPLALGHVGRRLSFLPDGRLLVGQLNLRIIDVSSRETVDVAGPRDLVGPIQASPDGRALLAFRRSLEPVRLEIDAAGEAAAVADDWFTVKGARQWHPHAQVALVETHVRHVDGEALVRLPADRSPLGWTPDGRGLLALRDGVLELWAA